MISRNTNRADPSLAAGGGSAPLAPMGPGYVCFRRSHESEIGRDARAPVDPPPYPLIAVDSGRTASRSGYGDSRMPAVTERLFACVSLGRADWPSVTTAQRHRTTRASCASLPPPRCCNRAGRCVRAAARPAWARERPRRQRARCHGTSASTSAAETESRSVTPLRPVRKMRPSRPR